MSWSITSKDNRHLSEHPKPTIEKSKEVLEFWVRAKIFFPLFFSSIFLPYHLILIIFWSVLPSTSVSNCRIVCFPFSLFLVFPFSLFSLHIFRRHFSTRILQMWQQSHQILDSLIYTMNITPKQRQKLFRDVKSVCFQNIHLWIFLFSFHPQTTHLIYISDVYLW